MAASAGTLTAPARRWDVATQRNRSIGGPLLSYPANLEQSMPTCGVPNAGTDVGLLFTEYVCAIGGDCPAGSHYPTSTGERLIPIPGAAVHARPMPRHRDDRKPEADFLVQALMPAEPHTGTPAHLARPPGG
jgi:hypothetical protein